MTTDVTYELQSFYQFIGQQLAAGSKMSVADAVAEFHKYQVELERFREEIQPGLDRLAQGEYQELDMEEFKRQAHARWQQRRSGDLA